MMRCRVFARKARAILTERDYAAALAILRACAMTASGPEDEERVEALLRELAYYDSDLCEARSGAMQATQPCPDRRVHPPALGRRWSDSRA